MGAQGFELRGGGGYRVAATTTHYIELAALLSLVLPFAIHFACFAHRPERRRLGLVAAVLIAVGITTTISRTGILAVVLMFVVLIPVWRWRLRYNILLTSVGVFGALAVVKPGLARTLLHLFDDPGSNPAFTVRAERLPLAFQYFAQDPWIGRGTGNRTAPQYQILDNQWLVTLISNGVIGVVALAGLHITGIVLAGLALKRSTSDEDRHLCAALISTQVIGIAICRDLRLAQLHDVRDDSRADARHVRHGLAVDPPGPAGAHLHHPVVPGQPSAGPKPSARGRPAAAPPGIGDRR